MVTFYTSNINID